jgi:GH24 family phage-related lysozyme (muramidase)
MPTSKAITASKFFGKDRYEFYLNELLTEKTVGGQKLSSAQLKEGFSKRKNKISFEQFVDKVISTKTAKASVGTGSAPIAIGGGFDPGNKGSLVKSQPGAIQKYVEGIFKPGKVGGIEENVAAIAKSMSSIAAILSNQKKLDKDAAAYDRRKAEQEKRELAENKLEKRFEGLKKAAEKILAPVKSILDKIINFLVTVFLGRVVYRLIEWFGDSKNADKVRAITRFLGDHWPKLLSLYLTFGTSLGRFALGLTRAVARGAIKLLAKIAMLAAAKKMRGARGVAKFLGGGKGKLLANVVGTTAAVGGSYALTQGLMGGGEEQKTQKFSGGGFVIPRFSGGGFNIGNLFGSLGGMLGAGTNAFSGFVSGEKGVDKVPAMLSDGEFVMSRGAVAKYGVDTLEAMNAAGGGTNKPKMMSGTTYAAGGGLIGSASNIIKKHEALSSLSPGQNNYVLPSSPEFKNINPNTKIYPYKDSRGIPTIGWGATYYDSLLSGAKKVKISDPPIKKSDADNLLLKHLNELIPKAKSVLPLFDKMSAPQAGTIISFLYNAGANAIDPTGDYPNFSKALIAGNMEAASKNNKRGGPSSERLKEESQDLLKGPKDLSKVPKQTKQKPQKNFFQKVQSGISSLIKLPSLKSPDTIVEKYAMGGYAPRTKQSVTANANTNNVTTSPLKISRFKSPKSSIGNNIKPLPRRSSASSSRSTGSGGGNYSPGNMGKGNNGSQTPNFSAVNPVASNTKQKTLGITR